MNSHGGQSFPKRLLVGLLLAAVLIIVVLLAIPALRKSAQRAKSAPEHSQNESRSKSEPRMQSSGEQALVQETARVSLQRMQEAIDAHRANAKVLQDSRVMDMKSVERKDQLETKREVVRRFLASNDELAALLANAETAFRQELIKLNVSQATMELALDDFRSRARILEGLARLRDADKRIADSMLGVLDMLDENWGRWRYNKEYDQVQLDWPGALKKYNNFMEEIDSATRDQKEIREQLVNLPNQPHL